MNKRNQIVVWIFLKYQLVKRFQRYNKHLGLKNNYLNQEMSKRKYLIKKEQLYTSIGCTILQNQNNSLWNCCENHQLLDGKMTTRSFHVNHPINFKQNGDTLINQLSHHSSPKKYGNRKSMQRLMNKSKQKLKIGSVINKINNDKTTVKRVNFSINFTSSLKQNGQNKIISTNTKLSNHKEKFNLSEKRQKIPLMQISREVINRSSYRYNEQKQTKQEQICEVQRVLNDQNQYFRQQQYMDISVNNIGFEQIDKAIQIQECIKIEKQVQTTISNQYLINIQSRVDFLQKDLYNKEFKIQQLLELLQNEELKFAKHQNSVMKIYKENEQLSQMLTDLQIIIIKISHENQQLRLQAQQSLLKSKQTQFQILQDEKNTLMRKMDRQNQEISKLNSIISTKDKQLQTFQGKYRQLQNQNASIIQAYRKIKSQLQQALKINEKQRFFKQLARKTQEKTTKSNIQVESFCCEKCNQVIDGNEITMDDLAKYHLNQKFKAHIKTYENEVRYWKDELQFMRTQYEHKLQNMRTNLECSYQKTLLNNDQKWSDEIKQLKRKMEIQQEMIQNYKNKLERSQTNIKTEINPNMVAIKIVQSARSNTSQNLFS